VFSLNKAHVSGVDMSLLHLLEGYSRHEALGLPGFANLGI
jgi:hypothetical protein